MAKTDLNWKVLYALETKLRKGTELNDIDKGEILKLLEYAKDDIYPSEEEYQKQVDRIERLDRISFKKNPGLFNKIADECAVFEGKYY